MDHESNAIARLTSVFRDKPRMRGYVSALATEIQKLDDATIESLQYRTLASAVGVQLEAIGRVVDFAKSGESDTAYRALLRGRIRILRSKGRPEDLLDALALILGDTRDVQITSPYGTAQILLEILSYHSGFSMSRIGDLIFKGLTSGVGMTYIYVTAVPASSFSFGSGASESEAGASTGWGDGSGSFDTGGALASAEGY